tara:strand:+ start:234 stop:1139 length:906 start_codon:yes stop_codon:yes gene_type:complete
MNKILIFFILFFVFTNKTFGQKINIENKIILNVPNNFIFIEGDSSSEFIKPIISFLGNDVKTYLIGTKNSVNFTKLYQENPDKMFEEIMIRMEKKNFKSQSSAENFLAKEIKRLFKKNNYKGIIWLVFSDEEVKNIDYEFSNLIDEIRNMDSQSLKKEVLNYQKEWDNVMKDALGELGPYAKVSKLEIKKNRLNDPYAEFSLNYKLKSFKGEALFYMSIKDNKPIFLVYECINSCPEKYNSLVKMISPTFSGNINTKINSINNNNNEFPNVVEQLRKLNDLYKSGALTKDEFEKAKKKIIN